MTILRCFVCGQDNNGGPDGCLDLDEADNGGLAAVIEDVDTLYEPHKARLSKADYWVLVGRARAHCRSLCVSFCVVRVDAHSSPAQLPSGGTAWSGAHLLVCMVRLPTR